MTQIIPDATRVAAKRGFVRSTAQAYATAIAGGISTTAILAVVTGEVPLVATIVTWSVAAVSPLAAGAASYLSILSKGIPEDYQPDEPARGRYGDHAAA
ncbi:hypothetical protein ACWGOE_07205 [Leucobacter chromiiresistens]